MRELARLESRRLPQLGPMSRADAEYARDPDVIHYKIDPRDLSPGVLERKFYIIEPHVFAAMFRDCADI
jgi:hypothetical protein